MASAGNTKTLLDGLMKDVYDDKELVSMVPDFGILYKRIPFNKAKQIGRQFVRAVALSREAGFTYGTGLQALAGIISQGVDDAKVTGAPMTLQAGWAYDAAAAMASDKGAFIDVTSHKFQCMMEAAVHRIELQILHGSAGIAVTDTEQDSVCMQVAAADLTVQETGATGTYVVIPINPLYWAAGAFAGAENSCISLYSVAADAANARNGAIHAGVAATANKFPIYAVNVAAKTVIVNCDTNTSAGNLVSDLEGTAYKVFFYGAFGNEMVGLRSIVANTGTLFGIAGATYSSWKGNTYAVGTANLTLKKVYAGIALAVGRGLLEDACVVVNPATFATMANDEAALRQYVGKVNKADRGVRSIEFVGPNGMVEIIPHPLMWESQAVAFPMGKAERIGASDLTFKRPGGSDEMIQEMSGYTGFECRLYSDQAIFLPEPAKCVFN